MAVWNFLPRPVSGAVTVRVPKSCKGLFDPSGRAVRCRLREEENANVLTFIAENVPPVGCKCYTPANLDLGIRTVRAEPGLLENEYLRVRIAENGRLTSVYDKTADREILAGEGNLLTVAHDKPVHESAWNLENDWMLHTYDLSAESVTVTESSAVRGTITAVYRHGDTEITQAVTLACGEKRLDFVTRVDWHAREKVLKAAFPLALRARYSAFEVAHGAVERPTFANNPYERAMFECCAHKWVDLSENDYGVSLLNDCKYGHDIAGNVMRITLMRGPVLPDRTADLGEQVFTYSLYPHAGGWYDADTVFEAQRLNEPLIALYTPAGKETQGGGTFLSLDTAGVVLDTVKPAEDGNGVIVRVYEAERKRRAVRLTLPFEPARAVECDLMEKDEADVPCEGAALRFEIGPFEVKTFRLIRA